MKYELVLIGRFKKGLKIAKKRGLNIALLENNVERLLHKIPLDEKTGIMPLVGIIKGFENVIFSRTGYYNLPHIDPASSQREFSLPSHAPH